MTPEEFARECRETEIMSRWLEIEDHGIWDADAGTIDHEWLAHHDIEWAE